MEVGEIPGRNMQREVSMLRKGVVAGKEGEVRWWRCQGQDECILCGGPLGECDRR